MKLIFPLLVGLILPIECYAAQAPQETIKLSDCDLQSIYNVTGYHFKASISCSIKNPEGSIGIAIGNKTLALFQSIKNYKTHLFNDQDAQELRSYLEMRLRLDKK